MINLKKDGFAFFLTAFAICLLITFYWFVYSSCHFINKKKYNYLINDQLVDVFDAISQQIDGFYYGRFDLRCQNVEALYSGDIKIMELNGAASEPAHIYAPNFPILEGYKSLFSHWKLLYNISIANHKLGVPYMSIRSGLEAITKSRFT